jgi:hypothetical protein
VPEFPVPTTIKFPEPVAATVTATVTALDVLSPTTCCTIATGPPPVTVRVVVPEIEPEVAWIVVDPAATVVARPAAPIVATVVADELQVAVPLKFWVVPSV